VSTTRVGIVGAGNISTQYLTHLTTYPDVSVVAIGDLELDRAAAQAEAYGVPLSGGADVVIDNPDVDLVVNLTIPAVHVAVSERALAAGKDVWTEKPLGMDRESARGMLDAAAAAGRRLGCAPDTVLGPGFQTALRHIQAGDIGTPISGLAIFQTPGPDLWHPSPEFLFARGGGPVLDIGPYYFTGLVLGLGPVTRVVAGGGMARTTRLIHAGPKAGTTFPVEAPTTANVLLHHASGATSIAVMSFDSPQIRAAVLEFTGSDAQVIAPDPNRFDGTVKLLRAGADPIETTVDATGIGRGSGVVDMVRTARAGQTHRANGELAYHVLDVMLAIEESIASGSEVAVTSVPPALDALPADWTPLA
jgi:predicted dehydrogenase